ncbi:MAG: S-layer homology domain-containing protein [Acidimicrobiia bacterium]|nr:S-layer homology domain-containing protein [Acidimicrobiia bacterium]
MKKRGFLAIVLSMVIVGATMVVALGETASAQTTNTFTDDDGNTHEANIEAIAAAGITKGCNPAGTLYCPSDFVTRAQMASFLARAFSLPAASLDYFLDDTGNTHEDNINRIAAAGITLGYPDGTFRPTGFVTRAQMGSFIARAMKLTPIVANRFSDVSGTHAANINAIAEAGVTLGCNPAGTLYCPNDNVRRDQMASFLARATPTTSTTTSTSTTTTSSTTTTTTVVTNPNVAQGSFGIYVDGTEPSAALFSGPGTEDTPAVVDLNETFSIRVALANTGAAATSVRPKLQFRSIGPSVPPGTSWSPWADVTGSSNLVRASLGTVVDGAPTTERLDGSLTFVPGRIDEVDGVINSAVALAQNQETEFLFSVRVTIPSVAKDQFQFRLIDAALGSVYDGYDQRPPAVNFPFAFANGFEAGTPGAVITAAGSANPDPWTQVEPGTVITYDNTQKIQATQSARFERSYLDLDSYLRLNDFNQAQHLYGRVYFRYTGLARDIDSQPVNVRIVDVVGGYDDGDQNSHSITVTLAGQVRIKAGGLAGPGDVELVLPSTTLDFDTWYRIEWHATTESAPLAKDGTVEVVIYNAAGTELERGSISAAPTLTEFEDIDIGPRRSTITAWIDAVALSNQGWLGP